MAQKLDEVLAAAAEKAVGGPNAESQTGKGLQPTPSVNLASALKEKTAAEGDLDKIQRQIDNLNTRYEAQKSEGKRLDEVVKLKDKELRRLEQEKGAVESKLTRLQPFIERLESDPNFAKHIEGYFGGGQGGNRSGPKPEDFGVKAEDLDMAEAISNPNSPSGQFFSTVVEDRAGRIAEKVVEQKLGLYSRQNAQEKAQETDARKRAEFLASHPDMTNDDLNEMLSRAKQVDWGYDDLFNKLNPGRVVSNVRQSVEAEVRNHAERLNGIPNTQANRGDGGSGPGSTSPDQAVFELIKANISPSIMSYAKKSPGQPF